MALKNYGVLKGRPVARHSGSSTLDYYHIHLVDDDADYRIAINVISHQPSTGLLYLVLDDYTHPLINDLRELPAGFLPLESKPGGLALDYLRGNLFRPAQMIRLPASPSGSDNELRKKIDYFVQRAVEVENALMFAFGNHHGPDPGTRDKYFDFIPASGVHDIHMNQGNAAEFRRENGTWQDGGLLIHLPSEDRWVAVFIAFQAQCWQTEAETGNCLEKG